MLFKFLCYLDYILIFDLGYHKKKYIGNMGAKTSAQTAKQSRQQLIRHVNPNEKIKQVQAKQIARGNPERDIDNCFVVDPFIKDISNTIINKEVDINTNAIKLNQQKLQGNFLKNKGNVRPINFLDNQLEYKEFYIQTQKSITDIKKLNHFDVPQFIAENPALIICKQCGRHFRYDIVQKHQLICKSIHKRKIFNSRKQRQISYQEIPLKYQDQLKKQQMHSNKEKVLKWVTQSRELRTQIKKNKRQKYQTLYEIKENQSNYESLHDNNCKRCGKIIIKRDPQIHSLFCCCQPEGLQKTIEEIKIQNIFEVPEYSPNVKLMNCGQCGRKFSLNRLKKHESVCKDVQKQKRNIFKSKNQRMNYEEQVKLNQFDKNQNKMMKKPMSKWREQSESLRSEIKKNMDTSYKTVYNVLDTSSEQNIIKVCQKCGTQIIKRAVNIHLAFCQPTVQKNNFLHKDK